MIEGIQRLIRSIEIRMKGKRVKKKMVADDIVIGDRVWVVKGYDYDGVLGTVSGFTEDGYKIICKISNREEYLVLDRSMFWKLGEK